MDRAREQPLRVYGGVAGEDRRAERHAQLIEAGLELLGAEGGESGLTVRGACRQAGLAPRYFYESFRDRDELAVAVFDEVVSDLARTTLEAVEAAPRDAGARSRAGLSAIVGHIARDPRRGRLLFSPALSAPALVHRRVEASRMFARLLVGQAEEFYGITSDAHLELVTDFLVGGLGQMLASWLQGGLDLGEEELVELGVSLFLAVAEGATVRPKG